MMRRVLLDTSALYASLDADDPNHTRARGFLTDEPTVYLVPDTVFSEAMTLIKLDLGLTLAIATGKSILAGSPFRLHRLSPEEFQDTWQVFSRYTDKGWSWTDCSILALARRLRVGEVFAFDHHFDQMTALHLTRVP
jgi:predicted nucleic acid-binding protein